MAYVKTLGENWTLTDGVLGPFALDEPMDVARALRAQGFLKARPAGLDALYENWWRAREWRYQTTFVWTGDEEYATIEAPGGPGAMRLAVNGNDAGLFSGDVLRVADITEWLTEGENRLEVFARPFEGGAGLMSPVRLRAGVQMTLNDFSAAAMSDAIEARVCLNAFAAGRYTFTYGLTLGDEAAGRFVFTEALRPGTRALRHLLPLEHPAPYDRARPEETHYAVRLSVERAGIGCLLAYAQAAFMLSPARRIFRLPQAPRGDVFEARMALMVQLGCDAVAGFSGAPERPEGFDYGWGLMPAAAPEQSIDEAAMLQGEDMGALAGGEKYWPPGGALWRLTQSDAPDETRMEALFGPNAMGDMGRAARLTRFLQAELVRRKALRARMRDEPVYLESPFEERAMFCGRALVEFSGAARPAYDALQEAWRAAAVCAVLPEDMRVAPGETAKIPIWLLSKGVKRDVVRVEAACLALDGKAISSASFSAMLGDDACVGELSCAMPREEGAFILRVEAVRGEGEVIARADFTLCACRGDAPLEPLMRLEGALLREKAGRLANEGARAALAVCSAGYRALLPGEDMACADTYECLNGLL